MKLNYDRKSLFPSPENDGFYAVATNLDDSAKDIIEISTNRYKNEYCFRVMKTNFSAKPVYLLHSSSHIPDSQEETNPEKNTFHD